MGRDTEERAASDALLAGRPVEFCGEAGVGKTALVRHLACHHPEAPQLEHVVGLRPAPLDDLLGELFDVFFYLPGVPDYVPSPAVRDDRLAGIQALVLLDNTRLSRDDVDRLRDVAGGCALLFTSRSRRLWAGDAHSEALRGLPADARVEYFERELRRPLADHELEPVRELCDLLEGFPWHIQRAAALVRDRDLPITRVADALVGATSVGECGAWLTDMVEAALTDDERHVVAVLRMLDTLVHLRHLAVLAQLANPHGVLQTLVELGIIEAHSPVYSLTGPRPEVPQVVTGETVSYLAGWAAGRSDTDPELVEDLPLLIAAVERSDSPADTVRLARAIDPALARAGRWTAWEAVLRHGLAAARHTADDGARAYFLHQLGTRAVCLGERGARELKTAIRLREKLGLKDAADVSRANRRLTARSAPLRLKLPALFTRPAVEPGPAPRGGGGGVLVAVRDHPLVAGVALAAALATFAVLSVISGGGGGPGAGQRVESPIAVGAVSTVQAHTVAGASYTIRVPVRGTDGDGTRIENVGLGRLGRTSTAVAQPAVALLRLLAGAEPKFEIAGDGCVGHVVFPGRPCVIRVRVNASRRARTVRLLIKPEGAPVQEKRLVAMPDPPPPPPGPSLVLEPAVVELEATAGELDEEDVQITGEGTVGSVELEPASSSFSLAGDCTGVVISADQPCTVTVRYDPAAAGSAGAQLVVTDSEGESETADLRGTELAPRLEYEGRLEVEADSVSVPISNAGTAPASLGSPRSSSSVVSAVAPGCSKLDPGAQCSVDVALTDSTSRPRTPVRITLGADPGPDVVITVIFTGPSSG